ncbi:MAG: LolA-related protein [Xanthomonadales bacterium]|nr:LolA-related protein [Xanthomonadales bacterium]
MSDEVLSESPPEAEPGDRLADRLRLLASQAGEPLYFEETRQSGLLDEPVTVRGRLIYDPLTGQLTKQVDSPRPARLSVTETHLVAQVGEGRMRRMPLDRRPDLAALLVAVRSLLAGDLDDIDAQFDTTLDSTPEGWTLTLVPRSPGLARDLRRLEVLGRDDRVHTLQAVLENGVQRMKILPAVPDDAG